jgi:hypothetical protein
VDFSGDVAELLTPLIGQVEAGELRFRRSCRYSDKPNRWEIIEI